MSQWVKISEMQKVLDQKILDKFQLTSQDTITERILALKVELSELANETRSFKYWSTKGMSDLPIILEEYADGIHFLVSLGNTLEFDFGKENLFSLAPNKKENLTELFLDFFSKTAAFKNDFNQEAFKSLFLDYLSIGLKLNLTEEQIIDFYIKKNAKNHNRQKNQY